MKEDWDSPLTTTAPSLLVNFFHPQTRKIDADCSELNLNMIQALLLVLFSISNCMTSAWSSDRGRSPNPFSPTPSRTTKRTLSESVDYPLRPRSLSHEDRYCPRIRPERSNPRGGGTHGNCAVRSFRRIEDPDGKAREEKSRHLLLLLRRIPAAAPTTLNVRFANARQAQKFSVKQSPRTVRDPIRDLTFQIPTARTRTSVWESRLTVELDADQLRSLETRTARRLEFDASRIA